jgi:hypothetical protein
MFSSTFYPIVNTTYLDSPAGFRAGVDHGGKGWHSDSMCLFHPLRMGQRRCAIPQHSTQPIGPHETWRTVEIVTFCEEGHAGVRYSRIQLSDARAGLLIDKDTIVKAAYIQAKCSRAGRRFGMVPTFLTFWAALSHRQHHLSRSEGKRLSSRATRSCQFKRMIVTTGTPHFSGHDFEAWEDILKSIVP